MQERSRRLTLSLLPLVLIMLSGGKLIGADAVADPYVVQGEVSSLTIDASGNRYIAGTFTGTQDFNPFAGIDSRTAVGAADVFITRFNADGSYGWTQAFGGTDFEEPGTALLVANGTLYVGGTTRSTNAGIGGVGTAASSGGDDAFVIALDTATGAAKTGFGANGIQLFGGSTSDFGYGLAADGTTLYFVGQFYSTDAGIGGKGTISVHVGVSPANTFILALDQETGVPQTAFSTDGVVVFGGSVNDYATSAVVRSSTLYVGGSMRSPDAAFDGTGSFASIGGWDGYILAIDRTTGALQTSFGTNGMQLFGGTDDDAVEALGVAGSHLYACGGFKSTDAGIGGTGTYSSRGNWDAYVMCLDSATGAPISGFGAGGVVTFGGTGWDYGRAMTVAAGRVVFAGEFWSTDANLNGSGTFASVGNADTFVCEVDATDGSAITITNGTGVETFGGTGHDFGTSYGVAIYNNRIYVGGGFQSTNAGFNGVGSIDATGFGGFLLDYPLDLLPSQPLIGVVPAILSFAAAAGSTDPSAKTSTVFNTGPHGTTLNWSAISNQPWLTVSPASGVTTTGTDVLAVSATAATPAQWTTQITTTNAPSARRFQTAVWTGTELIVWGGQDGTGITNTGGRYNPVTNTWSPTDMSTINAPTGRLNASMIWTGTEVILWGGYDATGFSNTGGRYNPATNTWAPTGLSTVGAPTSRWAHSAVWTGSEMIIWGGVDGTSPSKEIGPNAGGRYNPATDTWSVTAMSNVNAPIGIASHSAVWTGTEMIVWGGDKTAGHVNTGARYNPASNTWAVISTINAPVPRSSHTAVWTGTEMIVWGGRNDSGADNTGGRYTSATDTWSTPTSTTNAPAPRRFHAAGWTGSEMIVWGGVSDSNVNLNDGKRYQLGFSLPAGLYTGNITVFDPAATNSPQTVTVSFAVNDPPVILSSANATPNPVLGATTTAVSVTATDPDFGPTALTYTWSTISGAGTVAFNPNGTADADNSTATFSTSGTYSLQVSVSDGAGAVTSTITSLSVSLPAVAPIITTAAAATPNPVLNASTTVVSVAATDPDSGPAPLTYSWLMISGPAAVVFSPNGTTGAATSTATFSASGTYNLQVTVSDSVSTVTSNITGLSVSLPNVAPIISTAAAASPSPVINATSTTVSVTASDPDAGPAALIYTWSMLSGPAAVTFSPNGTTAALSSTVAFSASGTYTFLVTVSDGAGTATSQIVGLPVTVAFPATVTTHPSSQTVVLGSSATFAVTVSGTAPFSYQWRKNLVPISGATSSSYTTPPTVLGENGANYDVVVTNVAGWVNSNPATLTVNPITTSVGSVILTVPSGSVTPVSTTITLTNNSASPITVTPSAVATWVTLSAPVTIPAGSTATVTITADPTGLSGTQTATVTLTNSSGESTTLPVTLTIASPPSSGKKSGCSLGGNSQSEFAITLAGLFAMLLAGAVLARIRLLQ